MLVNVFLFYKIVAKILKKKGTTIFSKKKNE